MTNQSSTIPTKSAPLASEQSRQWPRWMRDALSPPPRVEAASEANRVTEPERVDRSQVRVLSRVPPRS